MNRTLRVRALITTLAAAGGLTLAAIAAAQPEPPHRPGMQGGMGQGMGGMEMMQGCPMMRGGGGGHGMMPHLPPGNEKLEMQMHADMMRAIADVLTKYAARLPDKK